MSFKTMTIGGFDKEEVDKLFEKSKKLKEKYDYIARILLDVESQRKKF
ncbi:hypothetical protein [Clostridium sp.]|nr:hypothetical protein [Clostridium sp.]